MPLLCGDRRFQKEERCRQHDRQNHPEPEAGLHAAVIADAAPSVKGDAQQVGPNQCGEGGKAEHYGGQELPRRSIFHGETLPAHQLQQRQLDDGEEQREQDDAPDHRHFVMGILPQQLRQRKRPQEKERQLQVIDDPQPSAELQADAAPDVFGDCGDEAERTGHPDEADFGAVDHFVVETGRQRQRQRQHDEEQRTRILPHLAVADDEIRGQGAECGVTDEDRDRNSCFHPDVLRVEKDGRGVERQRRTDQIERVAAPQQPADFGSGQVA